jgi:DNA-nicking Smr family endonuclease
MNSPSRNRLTEADRAAWESYASRIRPLPGRRRPTIAAGLQASVTLPARSRPAAGERAGHAMLGPLAIGMQPGGLDSATWHRFRTGKLPATRVLDLHGHTAQRAFHSLATFLRVAQAEGSRHVEVVTGQGGVLRREMPLWLNLPELRGVILAAAHPHAANPGSVRLLLRRLR